MFDGEAFKSWLAERAKEKPNSPLYAGHDKEVKASGNASQAPKKTMQESLGKQMMRERLEFDKKQATSDHDDDPFDAIEVWEDDK